MKKNIYIFILTLFFFGYSKANSSFLYQYKITFKQNPATKLEEAKDWIRKFAHTSDLVVIEDGKSIQIKTTYKINTPIFLGKFEKLNFSIESIVLNQQTPISDEAKDRIEKFEQEKEAERIKSGK